MNPKVLIADDSKFSQKIIRSVVEASGFEVIACANDGAEALALFKIHSPDIVLLDVTMPNMSGKECLIEIMKVKPDAVVFMITALKNAELEAECLKIGAKYFLSKSAIAEPGCFKDTIQNVLADFVK